MPSLTMCILRLQFEHFHFVLIGFDLFNIKLTSKHFCGGTLDLLHLKFLNFVRCLGHLAEWLFEMKPTTCHIHWRAHGPKTKRRPKETLNLAWHTPPHSSELQLFAHYGPLTCGEPKALSKDSLGGVGDPSSRDFSRHQEFIWLFLGLELCGRIWVIAVIWYMHSL